MGSTLTVHVQCALSVLNCAFPHTRATSCLSVWGCSISGEFKFKISGTALLPSGRLRDVRQRVPLLEPFLTGWGSMLVGKLLPQLDGGTAFISEKGFGYLRARDSASGTKYK